ncbi:Heterokaryon incompatibility protein 6 [Colletotrichum gloeosporioides]|uniref:Heterokaryon incompatibility protein 6 n=1 Tax=Colletotrichum gloeosporioides TaxID=474922 RepID=A0A8H4FNA3_COLGL|nr:Heterokaryon incompatibility protein 6 [Colletotrichum gloeosporioides]KAF3808548.1 Heterokaryon incompatibility protein 6 [Colletotrichum gloeosporioides]
MYTVLDPTKREVRLLRLLAGNEADGIHCELHATSLDSPDEYEALSYVWGSASDTRPITLQQTAKNVTMNLEAALRHLRYPDRARMLWVDVLCIDQENVQERNQQVRWMSDIYSTATQVVVWLGPATSVGFKAIATIQKYAADSELHWPDLKHDLVQLFQMYHFLHNEWWSRVWTVQEAVLARQLTYQYGPRLLSESDVLKAAASYRNHTSVRRCCYSCLERNKSLITTTANITVGMEGLLDLVNVRANLQKEKLRFDEVISKFRTRRATDPCDKVFGLLGISRGVRTASIDYALTAAHVFEETTREIMSYCTNLDILSHCANQAYRKTTTAGLPSWVPDWGAEYCPNDGGLSGDFYLTTHRLAFLDVYNVCGRLNYTPCAEFEESILCVQGVVCDRIERVGRSERVLMTETGPEYLFAWWEMLDIDGNPGRPYRGRGTISDAFWRTICLDIGVNGLLDYNGLEAKQAGYNHERMFMRHWDSELTSSHRLPQLDIFRNSTTKEALIQHLMRASGRRQFFISTEGFIGLGPPDIKVGDKICVFAGGKMPFIVRDMDDETQGGGRPEAGTHLRLLGDAYVHGLMYGQGVKRVEQGVEELKVFNLH